jgi:type IV pilus assembly protein PilM
VGLAEKLKDLSALFEGSGLEARLPPRYPAVAVEITPDRVTAVRVATDRKTKAPVLRACATHTLPEGAIDPAFARPNVLVPEPVASAIQAILAKVGPPEHRVSLLLPDHVARVSLLSFTSLPRTRRELAEIVRFRMAKSLPFKPEEAVMDLMVLSGGGAGGPSAASVLAVFLHRAVLEQYEALLTACGFWPGLVGLSTFELYNLFRGRMDRRAPKDKDALFLNVTPHYQSLLIFRGEDLIFYRCKPHAQDSETEDPIAGLRRELYTSLAFYQEKLLGRGLGGSFLRVDGLALDAVREAVRSEAGCDAEALDLTEVLPIAEGLRLDAETASRVAPPAGAVAGRRP